ncbi:CUB and sushi domain-containing protein 3-like [Dreissena polymorpha]|uniref:CUB and sushi domain-containing protein 3-like n=1 Tax=Dreissena polymorpha TaxID=45954 RepID=UPI0022650AB2|nr:CUB and sushi domain-containing protein 3-like [Dreissena polymorpha]
MADCGTPSAITGGSVLTSGPYTNGSYAVYTCTSGYVMSGTAYIECLNGTWSVDLPACFKQDYNQVYNNITDNHQDIPNWLLWMFGVIAVLLILLLLACVFAWCLQCLG